MKNKKLIAFGLCIGMILSSIGGVCLGNAKDKNNNAAIIEAEKSVEFEEPAPTIEITKLEPEIQNNNQINTKANRNSMKKTTLVEETSEVIYKGTVESIIDTENDLYNISGDDLEKMLEKGYSIEDIFKADEVANEIYEEPEDLLNEKYESGKTFDKLKEDIVEERKESSFNKLIVKYKDEYIKLQEEDFSKEEISSLLSYLDINELSLTDSLIESYKEHGYEIFIQEEQSKLSQKYIEKYDITDDEATNLNDERIAALERISENTGKSVKSLIKSSNQTDNGR